MSYRGKEIKLSLFGKHTLVSSSGTWLREDTGKRMFETGAELASVKDRLLAIGCGIVKLYDSELNQLNWFSLRSFYNYESCHIKYIRKIGKLLYAILEIETKDTFFKELVVFGENGEILTPCGTRPLGRLVEETIKIGKSTEKKIYTVPVEYRKSKLYFERSYGSEDIACNKRLNLKLDENGVVEYGRIKMKKFSDSYIVIKRVRSVWHDTDASEKMYASIEINGKEFKVDANGIKMSDNVFGGCFKICRETDPFLYKGILSYDGKTYVKIPEYKAAYAIGENLIALCDYPVLSLSYSVISSSGKTILTDEMFNTFSRRKLDADVSFTPVVDKETGGEKILLVAIRSNTVGCIVKRGIRVDSAYTRDSEVLFSDGHVCVYMNQKNPFKDGTKEALAFDIMKYEVRKNYLLSF